MQPAQEMYSTACAVFLSGVVVGVLSESGMMDAMVEYAIRERAYAISLEVRESNLAARNLYESYGFTAEAVRKGYYRNPSEDAVIMWKRKL